MIQRFASASAVASVVIAVAAGILRVPPLPDVETRYLATSVWCVVPLAWGLWAMLMPRSWLPRRLPLWGAILGLLAGLLGVFVLNLPARIYGEPMPTWTQGPFVLLAIGVYYLLWLLVRRVHRALAG
ncbi:MAG: hypothetical protein A3D93_02560 [Acidobacteria bacterium RIFCSPHIGHO2_12_FULL_67_30]|nr:MAG: hypothetical protein A2620_03065 [Acidobacteria bacterium RIFCSPHIGHO2_01_FULL_67_28]OFV87600.1 MAG: hypothetical protein A3D93_02560 [Acidobacteria bacterium RIFCSPHIGHO2_12_FULL_67_30]